MMMSHSSINAPNSYPFHIILKVRIDDLNYGNHLSNDSFLKYMHEARMQFLQHLNLTEMDIGGCSLIMGDLAIRFQRESLYNDLLKIEITAANFGTKSFDLFYRFTRQQDHVNVCEARTRMVCFDYQSRKTVHIPDSFKQRMEELVS